MNTYNVTFSNACYVCKKGVCDWNTEDVESKEKGGFTSFASAMEYVKNKSEHMEGFGLSTVQIEDTCCGEVYSSIPSVNRCACCKNEVWERMESDDHHVEKIHEWQKAE